MLGFAILFCLALWFIIVCLATFLPLIRIKDKGAARITAFIGFMLTFGIWWLYMVIDGYKVYLAGKEACKQAKVTVYVPYEKWVEMIGGRDALAELAKYGTKSVLYDISKEERQKYPDYLIFGGVRYNLHDVTYKRVLIYYSYNNFNSYTKLNSILYYDWEAKTALYKYTWIPSNEASWISPSRLLGIRSGHDGCFPQNEPHYKFRNLYAPD